MSSVAFFSVYFVRFVFYMLPLISEIKMYIKCSFAPDSIAASTSKVLTFKGRGGDGRERKGCREGKGGQNHMCSSGTRNNRAATTEE